MRYASAPAFSITNISKYAYVFIYAFLIVFLAGNALAGTFEVFGPEIFERHTGKPKKEIRSFSVINPNTEYLIKVYNGGLVDSGYGKVSSAVLKINGINVVGPKEFKNKIDYIEKQVALNSSNELMVEVRSKPGGAITIEIIGIDNERPIIEPSISPPPNEHGWNNDDLTVSFTCSDAFSGILSCPEPVTIGSEGKDQIVTGTATDNAGNTKEVSVSVNIDKTPPSITRSWPPDDNFGTDRSTVEIEGAFTDDLSGMIEGMLLDDFGEVDLPDAFLEIRPLHTEIPNEFRLSGIDRAGNSIQEIFFVRYTLGLTVSPTDPAKTEVVDGLKTSVDRAIVRFLLSVDRDRIYEIASYEDGRVAGFLPAGNIAIVAFETEHVTELKNKLNVLKDKYKSEVDVAIPVIFPPTIAFDNDFLGANGAAYDNIRSSDASQWIIDSGLALNFVNIAVIETGLEATYGQNNEFANIDFFNLCTPEGQQGQTEYPDEDRPDHHGTKITGILAGANNSYGNNGVISGITSSQFGVDVFRMNCNGSNDLTLVLAALDMIIDGTVDDIDTVNMSFGYFAGSQARDIYKGYFDSPVGREILWVGGAGNDDQQIACNEFFPSGLACDLDNVISVAAYDPVNLLRSDWTDPYASNYGEGVTLSAPGTNVWTACNLGEYCGVNGTSASTPLVTGAAALMLAVNSLNPSTVKQLLVDTTQPLNDLDLPEGGLNILAFLQAGWDYVDVVYVASNGDCGGNSPCYSTIQDGINGINGYGGTVKVSQGTYNENIKITSSKNGLLIQGGWLSDFTTRSEVATLTIIDGDTNDDGNADGRVFRISARDLTNIEATIEGFTITNGIGGIDVSSYDGTVTLNLENNIINWNEDFDGGGIRINYGVDGNVTLVLRSSTIEYNIASSYHGGGIYASGKGTGILNLYNSTITNNSAGEYGGGIYASSLSGFGGEMTLNLTYTEVRNNNSGNSGGGVYATSSSDTTLSFLNNVIAGNSAVFDGGGIVLFSDLSGTTVATLTNNTIEDNIANVYSGEYGGDGGGIVIYSDHSGTSDATLINNTITGNNATNGAAVFVYTGPDSNSIATIVNSIFTNNEAIENGGAIYNYNSSSTFTNCTFYDNFADVVGGAIYNDISNPIIKNCILWDNTASAAPEIYNLNSTTTVTYSDVDGGYPGTGNINSDPLFVDRANSDLHILVGSPCIDTGTSVGAPSYDIENILRPQGAGYDMGAYEFH